MSSSPVSAQAATPPASQGRTFTLRERFLLWLISWAGYLVIAAIGSTLRCALSWEDESLPPNAPFEKPGIYALWHRALLPSAWMFRNLGIVVLVSRSFDGEYIARIIERLGFVAVRGSSSRGGVGGLLGMVGELKEGSAVALTIDGPRGPKYVAKAGPAGLSKVTGIPMVAFYAAASDAWVLKTWDEFVVPKPFSRVLVRASRKMTVAADADDAQMSGHHAQLQAALERVTKFAEENAARAGSTEFPEPRS